MTDEAIGALMLGGPVLLLFGYTTWRNRTSLKDSAPVLAIVIFILTYITAAILISEGKL